MYVCPYIRHKTDRREFFGMNVCFNCDFFIKLYVRICSIMSYTFIRNFTVYICHFVNIYQYRIDVYLIYPSYIYLFVQDMMWSICNLPHHLFNASIYLSSIPLTIYPAIYIEYNRTKVSIYLYKYISI